MTNRNKNFKHNDSQGFTLVELSIVLVIIGLIVGGILVGADLIRGSEIRATVGQIHKYNSAVNTFRSKYSALPGDIVNAKAVDFGFTARTTSSNAGEGDGNGLIEGSAAGATVADGETVLFWHDLSDANLIDGNFTGTNAPAQTTATAPVGVFLPPAKIAKGNHISVYGSGSANFFQIATITAIDAAGVFTMTDGLTPREAWEIESKMDDGLPNTGIAIARGGATMNSAATAGAGGATAAFCVDSSVTPNVYNMQNLTPLCMLRLRFN